MYPCIKAFFFLLTYIAYALCAPPPLPAKGLNRPTGCHNSHDNNHAFIFFQNRTDFVFDFGIKTHYRTFYPKALESALRLDGFWIGSPTSADKCGWQKANSVFSPTWAVGGHRGDIFWKHRIFQTIEGPKDRTSRLISVTPELIPPRTDALPSNDVLSRITRILRDNEPAADVYQLSTICLGYACGFLSIFVFLLLIRQVVNRDLKSEDNYDPGAIELEMIRPNSTAKLTPNSEAPGTIAVPPDALVTTVEANDSGCFDPPPRYSTGSSQSPRH